MKNQLIENLEFANKHRKEDLYLSMQKNIPGKIKLLMGVYIDKSQMDDLLDEFGNHAGIDYGITINDEKNIVIEIFVK